MNFTQDEMAVLGAGAVFFGLLLYVAMAFARPFFDALSKVISYLANVVFGSIIVSTSFNRDGLVEVLNYLKKHSTKVHILNKSAYDDRLELIKKLNVKKIVFFEDMKGTTAIFEYKNSYILCRDFSEVGESSLYTSTFYNLRGSVDWKKLLYEVSVHSDEYDTESIRFEIRRYPASNLSLPGPDDLIVGTKRSNRNAGIIQNEYQNPVGYTLEELGEDVPENPIKTIAITPNMKKIFDDVTFWFGNKKWFTDRGLTWKRGYCLYGPPGTGKTTLVRTIAQQLNIPLVLFSLSNIRSSEDFLHYWSKEMTSNPKVIVFEDFDASYDGREPVGDHCPTFDTILNAIDGVAKESGRIIFITTNHIDKIDPAMLRPGRVDISAELGNMDASGRTEIARKIMLDMPEYEIINMVNLHSYSTPAQFQEACVQRALSNYRNG